jgi:hypothetical protein
MKLPILLNAKTTKELVTIDTHKKITTSINEYLNEDKFNYVVTSDNLKEVKKNNTELNKSKDLIKEVAKKLIDSESQDINTFKTNLKEYLELFENKRQDRLKDIEVFESQTKDKLKALLFEYCNKQVETLSIRAEFDDINYNDLVLVSNYNEKGNSIAKSCRDKLDMRIQQCKTKQDKYDMRLLQLENICYQNGLESPLTLNHIQGIINEPNDEVYNEKLNKLINDELERVANIKKQLEHKAEIEAKNKVNEQISKIRSAFQKPYGMMCIADLEIELSNIQRFDISIFDLCLSTAEYEKKEAITKINQALFAKRKAVEEENTVNVTVEEVTPFETPISDLKDDYNPFDVPIVSSGTVNIKPNGVKLGDIEATPSYDLSNVNLEDGQKVVLIKTVFKVICDDDMDNEDILNAVKDEFKGAGLSEDDFLSFEVVE